MSRINSEQTWIEVGYTQFAAEGLEGIQVERLARVAELNKSGFYHYFGDRESYLEALMTHHLTRATAFRNEMLNVKQFDPEFMNGLISFTEPILFHYQLVRNKHHALLYETYQRVNEQNDPVNIRLFADFIGFKDHEEFAGKYYAQVRDMFYTQISRDQLNYPFLRTFMYQAREVIHNAVTLATSQQRA